MVYLKMVTGTPYEVRMFYQKLKKWSSVWLIKYVWFNIFWLFGPKYVLIPTYGLFETEEYYLINGIAAPTSLSRNRDWFRP